MENSSLKTGIFFWFGYPIPPEQRLRMIADAGFDDVSFWWGDEYIEQDGPKELLPDLARAAGLHLDNVHAPFENSNLIWIDGPDGDAIVDRNHKCIEDCAKYGISKMVVHISGGDTPPPPNQPGIDRLRRLTEFAERKNVIIALENLRRTEYLDYVFSRIQSPSLQFCYDSGHENCRVKLYDILDRFGDKLAVLHLHDNDGTEDQHRIPGEGTIDWTRVAAKLRALRFPGPISVEATRELSPLYLNATAEEFLRAAHDKAVELVSMIEAKEE